MLISELLAGLSTKLVGLGMAAKAGMGLAVAAAGVTTAGAAGVLPAPVQHAVATTAAAATPFTFPDSARTSAVMGATVSADATGASDGVKGVDGQTVAEAAKAAGTTDAATTDAATSDAGTHTPVGANTGATGLDRANQTPAAGHVPTSVPVPQNVGSPAAVVASTPAADHVPTSVPAIPAGAGSQAATGLATAATTPAAGHVPSSVPGRP